MQFQLLGSEEGPFSSHAERQATIPYCDINTYMNTYSTRQFGMFLNYAISIRYSPWHLLHDGRGHWQSISREENEASIKSINQFINQSINQSPSPSIHQSINPSISPCMRQSLYLFIPPLIRQAGTKIHALQGVLPRMQATQCFAISCHHSVAFVEKLETRREAGQSVRKAIGGARPSIAIWVKPEHTVCTVQNEACMYLHTAMRY